MTNADDIAPGHRVIAVTGASSGIGAAVAAHLAGEGHHVLAGARRADRLEELVRAAEGPAAAAGGSIAAQSLDVTSRESVDALVTTAREHHGRLDVIVNNAGIMPLSRLDALLVDEWDAMIDVNVRGLLHGIAATIPVFAEQGHGHVIATASVGAHEVVPTSAVYSATKHAAWAVMEGLRQESDPSVRVTTITPGVVESELASTITDPGAASAMADYRAASIPPEAIARAVAFAIGQPEDVDVNEIIVRPTRQR